MAYTAHQDPKMMEELRETSDSVREKAVQVATLMRAAKHVVVFTGAGISTDAGIADYRGPQGVWTLTANCQEDKICSVEMTSAVPTRTHMALTRMLERGLIHHVISQNVDGLHRKSGVSKDHISELHGNGNVECCSICRREYLRDFSVQMGSSSAKDHQTGRRCVAKGCGGLLRDTIINFGEQLPLEVIAQGFAHSEEADLHLVLGSSLTVAPASDLPRATKKKGGALAIVNLQRTPQDSLADVRVHCGIADFIDALSIELDFTILPFQLQRAAAVWRTGERVCAAALDTSDLAPATLFRRCTFKSLDDLQAPKSCCVGASKSALVTTVVEADDSMVVLDAEMDTGSSAVSVKCEFYGHYNEPAVELVLPAGVNLQQFRLSLNPLTDLSWTSQQVQSDKVPSADDILPGKGWTATPSSQPKDEDNTDYSGWFAVEPVDTCAHCDSHVLSAGGLAFDMKMPCTTCGNIGENMLCLGCHEVHCGRHVHQHMLAHHESTGHKMVCGFIDLSFWCYGCDHYVNPMNPKLAPYYVGMHTAKFGAPPPRCAAMVAAAGSS